MSVYHFYHPIEVRYGDLDPQGHVNNAKFLTYFEQARLAYWVQLGLFTRDQSFIELGIILADVHIAYRAPVFYGQNIKVGVHVARLGSKSMTWKQNVVDADTGKELANGEVIVVAYDYRQGKTIPVPEEWREKIRQFEGLKV